VFKFPGRKKPEATVLDTLISRHVSEMAGFETSEEDYTTAVNNLKILLELKATEPRAKSMDPNTLAVVGGNLAGIALILITEMTGHIITSKSMPMVIKPRT
jgi:hypothetical protein